MIEEANLVERSAHLEIVLTKAVEPLRTHKLVADARAGAAFVPGIQLCGRRVRPLSPPNEGALIA